MNSPTIVGTIGGGGTYDSTTLSNPSIAGSISGTPTASGAWTFSGGGTLSGTWGGNPTLTGTWTGGTQTGADVSANVTIPTGGTTSVTQANLAVEGGVPIETFFVGGDTDYTAAFTRAVAAGVPIQLKAATYTVNNFNTGSVASFVLRGIPGKSIIQRTVGTGSSAFFEITATTVDIQGVTFDSNSGSVSANQWGVLIHTAGANVTLKNDVFKNNSGTLGACAALTSTGPAAGGTFLIDGIEATNCATLGAVYLGSVTKGRLVNSYIHDVSGMGIFVGSVGVVSASNLSTDILISHNTIDTTTLDGISVGGFAPPYSYTNPQALRVTVSNNNVHNGGTGGHYGIDIQAEKIKAINNTVWQDSSAGLVGGILCALSKYGEFSGNYVNVPGAPFTMDCGGAVDSLVNDNTLLASSGIGLNLGAGQDNIVAHNAIITSGTTIAVDADGADSDGSGVGFPLVTAGMIIENNRIVLTASSATGINLPDDPGSVTSKPMVVRNNQFDVSGGGSGAFQDIIWHGQSTSMQIYGNRHNGLTSQFVDPDVNNDITFDNVFYGGSVLRSTTTTTAVRSIIGRNISQDSGKITWVNVSSGGSGYTAATTLSASCASSGGTDWAGTPFIDNGVIISVRTTTFGTACVGAITVVATDSGGGTGATFTSSSTATIPSLATISYVSASDNALRASGGLIGLSPVIPVQTMNGTTISLQAAALGTAWRTVAAQPGSFSSGSLPTCDANSNGATIVITGSGSGAWWARCNATNWIYADGTVAP